MLTLPGEACWWAMDPTLLLPPPEIKHSLHFDMNILELNVEQQTVVEVMVFAGELASTLSESTNSSSSSSTSSSSSSSSAAGSPSSKTASPALMAADASGGSMRGRGRSQSESREGSWGRNAASYDLESSNRGPGGEVDGGAGGSGGSGGDAVDQLGAMVASLPPLSVTARLNAMYLSLSTDGLRLGTLSVQSSTSTSRPLPALAEWTSLWVICSSGT